ncbi:MAG: Type 1 glutamine amidotransferase-like domain-containing protein [Clostridia bacterium]|nr:Type 1 glutamine amidotransferase-like domain-containing protein [Clostridia bacterium]
MSAKDKYFVLIGGGEIRNKTTLKIDEYIARLAKIRAEGDRPRALFIGTASHDFMPYFNSFRKTYTGELNVKVDCLLTVYTTYGLEKIKEKFDLCDVIYVGGGDTLFMIEKWKEIGIIDLIKDAYERGVIICGLSAGAICWFDDIYTDSAENDTAKYAFAKGLGIIKDACSPHYNLRKVDLFNAFSTSGLNSMLAIEDDCALIYKNEKLSGSFSAGGNAYVLRNNGGTVEEYLINDITGETL